MRSRPPLFKFAAGLALAALALAAVPSATGASGPRPGQVLLERFVPRDGAFLKTLFVARTDGIGERPLLDPPVGDVANNLHAEWSPDGRWVAFEVLETTGDIPAASVWVVGADGLHPQPLVSCSAAPCAEYAYPSWSPDGQELAMIRFGTYADGSCCTSDLVVFDVARSKQTGAWSATNEQVVASFGDADVVDTFDAFYDPTWSSDGRRIAYTVEQYDAQDPFPFLGTRIAVVSITGGDARFITPLALNAGAPDWHPCADLIAFNTYPLSAFQESTAPGNVYTVRPDGRRLRQLTTQSVDGSLRFGAVNWNPDGRGFTLTLARAANGVRLSSVEVATLPAKGGTPVALGIAGAGGSLRPTPGEHCER